MSEWIRTSERVPEVGERVLCIVDRVDPTAARHWICWREPRHTESDYQWFGGSAFFADRQVTHWMPLPPLPTDADDGGTT